MNIHLKLLSLCLIMFYRIENTDTLEVSLSDLEEYQRISQPYEELMGLPKVNYREFPKSNGEKIKALQESHTLNVSESYLIQHKFDAPETFIFSPHIVDCVGLVVTQNMSDHRCIYVAHLARNTKEKMMVDFQSHKFSPAHSTVLMITSVQSDVLLFVFQQLKHMGFQKIFAQFGPFVRSMNKFYVPRFFFSDLPKEEKVLKQLVKQWSTSTLILGTASDDLYTYDKSEDWLDSEKILQLKKASK